MKSPTRTVWVACVLAVPGLGLLLWFGEWADARARPGRSDVSLAQYQSWYPHAASVARDRIMLVPIASRPRGVDPGEIAQFVAAYYAAEVEVGPPLEPPAAAWDPDRGQFDASLVCHGLRSRVHAHTLAVLGVTDRDLSVRSRGGVFGLGSIVQRVAVVSTARLAAGGRDTVSRLRVLKVAVHEIGHALGLTHCEGRACNMSHARTVAELDALPLRLCPQCLRKVLWRRHVPAEARGASLDAVCARLALSVGGTGDVP